MAAKDINAEPFDEQTITKLEIFENYLEAWLPVFIHAKSINKILICDFFAGSGHDSNGVEGSPLRILKIIDRFEANIKDKGQQIHVVLNEKMPEKAEQLRLLVNSKTEELRTKFGTLIEVECQEKEFTKLFEERENEFFRQPNLFFIDQYGVKEVDFQNVFPKLINIEKTDFLFFVASSFIRRFAERRGFRERFPELDPEQVKDSRLEDVHRIILDMYKKRIPPSNKTRLYGFAFKKISNLYGLIFGSKHPLGAEKFLKIAWDKNRLNGEADFNIDSDKDKEADLFPETIPLTKIEKYKKCVGTFIYEKGNVTNMDLFHFTLENGHIPQHTHDAIQELRKSGKIECDARIGISYDTCYNKKIIKTIRAVRGGEHND